MLLARDIDTRRQTPMEATELLVDHVQYILAKAQLAGNMVFDGHVPSSEEKRNAEECRLLCDKVERRLKSCKVNEIPALLGCYDFLYMIGNRRMPSGNLAERYKQRMIDAWKGGDKTIQESDVYGILLGSTHNPMRPMSPTYQQILNGMRENWVRTLEKYNSFPDSNTYERYSRLALIMRDNIDSCSHKDSVSAKRAWFKKNKIDNISSVGTKILVGYRQFVNSLFPAVLSSKEMRKLEVDILKELVARKDLNDYNRQEYQIALTLDTDLDS